MKETIFDFLDQLSAIQELAITVLREKQFLLVNAERSALDAIAVRENELLVQLKNIQDKRKAILQRAEKNGIKTDSIATLCEQMFPNNIDLRRRIDAAKQRSRQIHIIALSNWTMTQRSITHLSQIMELIETRGLGKTTYPNTIVKSDNQSGGNGIVDHVA
ncbi:MAG: flagellar protein FlgN [Planctomycetaceae bacterium]|jgi:flagellar biosynthesis GTPase FlhF|nr:flagellar protein FlgN [Planctomycetaceae bacterium]